MNKFLKYYSASFSFENKNSTPFELKEGSRTSLPSHCQTDPRHEHHGENIGFQSFPYHNCLMVLQRSLENFTMQVRRTQEARKGYVA